MLTDAWRSLLGVKAGIQGLSYEDPWPLATALPSILHKRTLQLPAPVPDMRYVPRCHNANTLMPHIAAAGVRATVDGLLVAVGKREWVEQQVGVTTTTTTTTSYDALAGALSAAAAAEPGCSHVWVGVQGRGVLGALVLTDTLRPDAARTVAALRQLGMR